MGNSNHAQKIRQQITEANAFYNKNKDKSSKEMTKLLMGNQQGCDVESENNIE